MGILPPSGRWFRRAFFVFVGAFSDGFGGEIGENDFLPKLTD
jgi:hypothetical protein